MQKESAAPFDPNPISRIFRPFVHGINRETVRQALRTRPISTNKQAESAYRGYLNLEKAAKYAPWLDLELYNLELSQMFSGEFWTMILKIVEVHSPDLIADINSTAASEYTPGTGAQIAAQNRNLFNAATLLIGAGAAFGPKLKDVANRSAKGTPEYEAAEVVAGHFPTTASNLRDLRYRLISVFSSDTEEGFAQKALLGRNAYKSMRLTFCEAPIAGSRCPVPIFTRLTYAALGYFGFQKKNVTCPAVNLTKIIYGEYAEQLKQPNHRSVLFGAPSGTMFGPI